MDRQEPKLYIASPKMIRSRLKHHIGHAYEIKNGTKGFVTGAFNNALRSAPTTGHSIDEKRYIVWGFCLGSPDEILIPLQTRDLSDAHFFALKKWIGPYKDLEERWQQRPAFEIEARQILSIAEYIERYTGEIKPIGEWLEDNVAMEIDVEPNGMASSAVNDMGGAIREYQP